MKWKGKALKIEARSEFQTTRWRTALNFELILLMILSLVYILVRLTNQNHHWVRPNSLVGRLVYNYHKSVTTLEYSLFSGIILTGHLLTSDWEVMHKWSPITALILFCVILRMIRIAIRDNWHDWRSELQRNWRDMLCATILAIMSFCTIFSTLVLVMDQIV